MQPADLELNANAQQFAEFLLDQAMTLRIAATILAGVMAFLSFYVWPAVRRHRATSDDMPEARRSGV